MIDVPPFVLALAILAAVILLLSMYWKMPGKCRGKELKVGKMVVCGGRAKEDGVEIREGWLYNTSLFGKAKFIVEGLPCTFELGGDTLVVKCEKPLKVRA